MELPTEQNLSLLRRYPLETLVTALFLALSVLSGVVYNHTQEIKELHRSIESSAKDDTKVLLQALEKNTEALNRISKNDN
jgi:predicted Holliday junction resolvase-like endonuclease